jgi:NAD(P)-dependent dehydrogenase (short-subunit alcohol dehydrogenase family)
MSSGSVAVVTGGSSGIGAAVARRLTKRGWRCVLIARGEDRLQAVAAEIGGEYEVCDVGDRDAVDQMAAEVQKRHPVIGLLVNNAGLSGRGPGDRQRRGFIDTDPEWIEEVFRINFFGAVWCLRAFLPALEAARPAHVVNIASVAGAVAVPPGLYSATKHALVAFSRSLAVSLPARGIHVHTVNPGLIETPGFPQRGALGNRLLERAVIEPEQAARKIVSAVERNRPEIFVPGWYRLPAVAQAVAPGLVSRVLARRRYVSRS